MIKRLLVLTIATLTLSLSSFAQLGIKGSFALGQPLDENDSKISMGFGVGLTYIVTEHIRAEVLFENLYRKESETSTQTIPFLGSFETEIESKTTITPITAGASYIFLTDRLQPYVGVNLGLYKMKYESTINNDLLSSFTDIPTSSSRTDSYFGFQPKAGLSFAVTDNFLIDVNVKYHLVFDKDDKLNDSNTSLLGGNIGLMYMLDL